MKRNYFSTASNIRGSKIIGRGTEEDEEELE